MSDIPAEVRRMADIYRQFCKEFGIPENTPSAENLGRMTQGIYQGAKGFGTDSGPIASTSPNPAQREVGTKTPASPREAAKGMVPGEKPGRETPHKESQGIGPGCPHETPHDAAPSNPATDKQLSYLKYLGYQGKKPLSQLTSAEASDLIGQLRGSKK